jgi:hypothetical protein
MATSKSAQQTGGRGVNFRGGSGGNSGDMGNDVHNSSQSGYVVIIVLLMVLFFLLLPMLAILYFDTLTIQKKAERTEARIEKLLKDLEKKDKQ